MTESVPLVHNASNGRTVVITCHKRNGVVRIGTGIPTLDLGMGTRKTETETVLVTFLVVTSNHNPKPLILDDRTKTNKGGFSRGFASLIRQPIRFTRTTHEEGVVGTWNLGQALRIPLETRNMTGNVIETGGCHIRVIRILRRVVLSWVVVVGDLRMRLRRHMHMVECMGMGMVMDTDIMDMEMETDTDTGTHRRRRTPHPEREKRGKKDSDGQGLVGSNVALAARARSVAQTKHHPTLSRFRSQRCPTGC